MESVSARQLFTYIQERGPWKNSRLTPIRKVRLSSEKHSPSACPTVSYTVAWLLSYPNTHLVLQMNERRFWREHWQHKIVFPMADQKSQEGLQKVECFGFEFAEPWRFTDWPLLLIKSKTSLYLVCFRGFLCSDFALPWRSAETPQKTAHPFQVFLLLSFPPPGPQVSLRFLSVRNLFSTELQ